MQHVFNLGKLLRDKGFQLCQREPRLRVGEALQQFSKMRSASEILVSASRPPMVFNHCDQMVGNFRRGRQDGCYLPCPALLSRISATRRKRSAFATDVPPNFNTRMVVTLDFLSKKSPHCSGAGFFLCFLYASARTVTCGNGDGDNGCHHADAFHGCCVLCNFICLCPVPILVKVSAGLSQRIFTFHPFHCSGSMRHNDLTIHLNLRYTALDAGRYNHT